MADEATTAETVTETEAATTETVTEDQQVPYERFKKANTQAKEAKDRATKLERDIAELRAQMEERETAGLPELERERKRAEQLEKRAAEAEERATAAETKALNTQRERWVANAAKDFIDADDAVRNVDLSDIETAEDAERAVKRVARAKPHLIKSDGPVLPGQVLKDGQKPTKDKAELPLEAQVLSEGLKQFASKP